MGSTAHAELAEGSTSEDVLAKYDARLKQALTLASSVHDRASREVLWNLCVLRVRLIQGAKSSEEAVRDAVQECRRRFIDPHEFNEGWPTSVIQAFEQSEQAQVQVEVRSVPARCTALIYGSRAGITPLRILVEPGHQEIQLDCNGRRSLLHHVHAADTTTSIATIWLSGDEAFSASGGMPFWLRYREADELEQVEEHARALALESRLDSFAIIRSDEAGIRVDWFRDGSTGRSVRVSPSDSEVQRATALKSVFQRGSPQDPGPVEKPGARRVLADYLLGGALIAAGAALMIYPLRALSREDDRVEAGGPAREQNMALVMGLFGSGTAAVASGALVIALGPFGQRQRVQVALHPLQLRGSF